MKEKNVHEKEEFARLVAAGVRERDAYKQAFGKPDMSDESARKAAWRLRRSGTVREKVRQVEAAADMGAVMKRERRMELLSREAEAAAREGDRTGLVKVIAELNKMDGAYEPEKVEVGGALTLGGLLDELVGE